MITLYVMFCALATPNALNLPVGSCTDRITVTNSNIAEDLTFVGCAIKGQETAVRFQQESTLFHDTQKWQARWACKWGNRAPLEDKKHEI